MFEIKKSNLSRINHLEIRRFWKVYLVLILAFLYSCSPVKFVPEDKYLLNDVEVEIDNSKINKEEAKSHVRQKENYKILGFAKFHLWLYNLSSKDKDNDWLKRIGEPPQIYDEGLTYQSTEQLEQYLDNEGFFNAKVKAEVERKEQKQKINVTYHVNTGEQYTIRKINYHIADSVLRTLFLNDSAKAYIRPGTPFEYDRLEEQRENIVDLYRNNGFYYFSKDDVRYLADSSRFEKAVVLDLYIGTPVAARDSQKVYERYYLNDFYISIIPGTTPLLAQQFGLNKFSDTLHWENYTLYRNSEIKYRPELFKRLMHMNSGELYQLSAAEKTFEAFNRLRQFRFIDIQFNEPDTKNDSNLLNSYIRLAPLNKQAVSFELEGTNSSGNLGVAGNVIYTHRNLFKGAEVFQINFKGAVERQQRVVQGNTEYFNTREFGVESKLTFPKLIGPDIANLFTEFLPKTVITLGYNFQRRPEYTRTISNVKFGYNWMTSPYTLNTWNLLDINMVNLYQFDPGFIDIIQDLYIKSSFTDHLILAMNYSFVYNTQELKTNNNYKYLRFNVESAGNVMYLLSSVLNRPKVQVIDTLGLGQSEFYRFLNTRFAQYLKTDLEFRYGYILDKYNALVGRAFVGVGFPYGNFDVLPFEKKYFTGGANGIRAWQVRSLGPGTYEAPQNAYPNQSSDIKLEVNAEYRFHLISFLEGALFIDAGNIWAINEKDNREGAQFKFDKFYKQIALGTGTGFRFDFSYFIFRLDLGVKLRDPAQEAGNGWIIGYRPYSSDDFNISFAIGYPF